VLFLPGQAGSYRQVRSFGTAAFKLETQDSSNKDVIDWFTIDFGDEWSGLSGIILERQAAFAARCVDRILTLYEHVPSDRRPRAVPLVGHSMGGVVARAVAALPAVLERQSVGTVVALHSPLTPAAVSHESVARFYASIEAAWCDPANARALDGVALLLSLGGGLRDSLVRSDLSAVPQRPCVHNVSYATVLPSIEGIQRSADHQCGVWCLEVAERVAQAFRRLAPLIDAPEDAKQRLALLKQHLGAPFRVLLRDGAALATTSTGSSGSQVVHAPATLKSNDVVTVSTSNDGGDNAWSHWVLLSTSPVARFVGRELPLLLTARDGLYINGAPRISVVPKLGAEILVRGATAGTTLVFTAQLAPAVEPIQFSLWRTTMAIDVSSLVVRIDIDHVPRGVALVARVEPRTSCSSRFVPRAIWCNDRCEATPSLPLIEDYFVGLDESSASAVRFFGSTDRLSLFAVTDAECVERIVLHIDWMASVGHLLRIHWQLLYTLTVVVALANASLAWLLGSGGGDRFARIAIGIAVIGTTALVQSSIEQLGVAVVALGTAAIVHDWLVRRLLQPLLRLVGWVVLLLFARRESVALVVVALVGFFDSAAALVLGMAVLAAASKSRDSATHVITLGLLVFPILATSTMVRIHAFTEHIEQAASGATYRGVLGILLPQFVVWPGIVELQPRAARLLLCAVGTLLAIVALVRQPSLAELINGVILYAVVGSILHAIAVWLAQSDEKAKRQ
jgi:pimeloyl-ACP methyl ester carboxylesterase